jgi:hypothetical protein
LHFYSHFSPYSLLDTKCLLLDKPFQQFLMITSHSQHYAQHKTSKYTNFQVLWCFQTKLLHFFFIHFVSFHFHPLILKIAFLLINFTQIQMILDRVLLFSFVSSDFARKREIFFFRFHTSLYFILFFSSYIVFKKEAPTKNVFLCRHEKRHSFYHTHTLIRTE